MEKRAKNTGDHFEEQVWEHLPYKRAKPIIKLHSSGEYNVGTGVES